MFALAATAPLRSSGAAVFRGDLLKSGGRVYSSPAVADGVVFVGSADGNLYAIH